MKKFRIQPEFSVIWLQRAIETGLGSDFVVVDELLGFERNVPLSLWRASGISLPEDNNPSPDSVNSSLLPSRSLPEKKQTLFGSL